MLAVNWHEFLLATNGNAAIICLDNHSPIDYFIVIDFTHHFSCDLISFQLLIPVVGILVISITC